MKDLGFTALMIACPIDTCLTSFGIRAFIKERKFVWRKAFVVVLDIELQLVVIGCKLSYFDITFDQFCGFLDDSFTF